MRIPRPAAITLTLLGGMGTLWHLAYSLVDWLSRFEWIAHQVTSHDWVADVIEAILAHPPPVEFVFPLIIFMFGIAILFLRRGPQMPQLIDPPSSIATLAPKQQATDLIAVHLALYLIMT
jgi:hypothetical protein